MAEIKERFIQVKTKANFVTKLTNGEIKDSSIAFIEDSNEIWAKGKYYPCPYTKESLDNKFNEYISLLQKGQVNGVATLDANGKVPVEQMPTTKTINGASIFGSGNLQLSASLYKIVDTLPTTGIDTSKIYLVPASATTAKNNKTEYIYLGDPNKAYDESKWEKLGDEQKSSTVTTPGGSITVDTALIENSPNPVAGGVVKAKIDEIDTKLAKKVESSDYTTKMTAIDSKLKTLENKTIDVDAELKDSPNPVQNRAVKKAVLNLNTEIGKKANSTDLNAATGKITTLETNAATILSVTGEGNGISNISKSGNTITATKGNFLTSSAGLATTAALNDGLAGKADVNHNHDTKYAAKEHTHPEYAQSSALNNYVTKTALDGKNFLTATALDGYVNEVQPDGTQSGNGIANITKEGKVLKVTKATFLTEHQSLADYATKTWVGEQGFAKGTIPTKTSELENDSGFLTQHQSLADYATQTWVNNQGFATGTIPTNVSQLTNDSGFLTNIALNGYVNNINVTEVTNGNGIASIAKNGKDINVTQGAFLTGMPNGAIYEEETQTGNGKGIVDIFLRGNVLCKRKGTFITPETLGTSIDDYASNKGYLTENNLNEKLKETVTIKLVSDKSASDTNLNGATITVKSGDTTVSTQTWQGTPINVKVSCDKEVTIEAAAVKMYMKPKVLKYVPSPLYNREVTFTYKALELGVFIIDKNDKTYKTAKEFNDSGTNIKDVIGTLLVTDNVAIVVANYDSGYVLWGPNVLIDGCTVANDTTTAVQDFAGAANTAAIMKVVGSASTETAASICYNYIFGNGRRGHLMSAGEGAVIQRGRSNLYSLMHGIGINTDSIIQSNRYYWTSTQKNASSIYRYFMYNDSPQDDNKDNMNYAIPIYSLYD